MEIIRSPADKKCSGETTFGKFQPCQMEGEINIIFISEVKADNRIILIEVEIILEVEDELK